MPLTKIGEEILKDFQKRYGKKLGTNRFYAYMDKYPTLTKEWHKK